MFVPNPFFRSADNRVIAINRVVSTIQPGTVFMVPYYVDRKVRGNYEIVEQVQAGLSYTVLPDCFRPISDNEAKQAEPMLYEYVKQH